MAESASRQRWEYRFERYLPDDALADGEHRGSGLRDAAVLGELGKDGWELVAVAAIMPYELIFKRPLVEEIEKK